MPLATRVTKLLAIEHPILLAPMDIVSGGRLAAAVTAAGGLGVIGGGYGDRDWLDGAFTDAGNARVGCGFITWSMAKKPRLLDRALARRPAAIILSFGDPAPFARPNHEAGAKLICQVQDLEQARQAADAGADIIVAQGSEGGGHGLTRATMTLVPAVADAFSTIPVVAAGGIADGRGLAAALMLGADGVMLGTRFYASQEAEGHARAKQRILEATGDDSVRSLVFDITRRNVWPTGHTGRVLRNAHTERWLGREAELAQNLDEEARRYNDARASADFNIAAVIAGEAAGLIHDIPSAAEIVERMVSEAEAQLARCAALARP